MSLVSLFGFGLKVGQPLLLLCSWFFTSIMAWFLDSEIMDTKATNFLGSDGVTISSSTRSKFKLRFWSIIEALIAFKRKFKYPGKTTMTILFWSWTIVTAYCGYWYYEYGKLREAELRNETLVNMCDERARMLTDQFNVSMNHIQALSILIATFHHGMDPSIIDQKTFARYTQRTNFERPLTSGVAYAVRVLHSEREQFERQHGWTIKKMEQNPVHEDDSIPELLEPSPIQEEYAPVIFAQDTIAHVVSIDMLSGKEDRENVLRARESGTGVLTAPFRLLKTNRLGVILTFAVYKRDLSSNATPKERIEATDGYLGGVFDVESLVERLLQQLSSKETILVDVYDTTNESQPISMYGSNVTNDELPHVSSLHFGDPSRRHEMHCRFKEKAPFPYMPLYVAVGAFVISFLCAYLIVSSVNQVNTARSERDTMMELKSRAEAADIAKSRFLATVSHEIRTPMNGVLGMLQMLMDTDLDITQQDYVRTAQDSGKALLSIINEVLDQAKIESGKLELEDTEFNIRAILDDVLSLFSDKSQAKGLELALCVSDSVPELLIGDPGRFRQIIINLMGNSMKFTQQGHVFVTVHLVEEVIDSVDVETGSSPWETLSGFPVVDRRKSWEKFNQGGSNLAFVASPDRINLIVSVEDTGEGIPLEAQDRIFTPFMQVGPSTSRKYGGTGIGLSISKCLVGLMKGEIGFESIPNIGTTFTFTAVFAKVRSNVNGCTTTKISKKPDSFPPEFGAMTALVVDPRPVRAKVSKYQVQRLGMHVEVASDLGQALSIINNGNADISIIVIEQEIWDRDSSITAHFVNNVRKIDHGASPKLFLLSNSINSSRTNTAGTAIYTPSVIMKPLRATMLSASLQRAMGVRNKLNPRNGDRLCYLLLGRKILIVDDNYVNRKVAAGALKKYGADVVSVESGAKAIKLLTPPHQFDACFMDIQMPEIDGFEATRRIRDKEKNFSSSIINGEKPTCKNLSKWHVPILAMTADVIQATQEECSKCGMDGYVSKPFEPEQLYSEVSRFFQSNTNAIL